MRTKKVFACILATCTMLGSLSMQGISTVTGMADDGVMRDDMTAQDYADDMGLGINLGNTMEAYYLDLNKQYSGAQSIGRNKPENYETCWGAVETTQAAIRGMKNVGFKTVRIPVYWGNMMKEDGTYTINSEYIGRVKEIVDYCRNAGVYAVINMHHYDEFVIRHFSTFGTLEECAETVKHLWTQIANYFKDYSDYLIFEGFNEYLGGGPYELDKNGKIALDSKGDAKILNLSTEDAYKWTNTLNQAFVDAVRATGGNNEKRMLVVSGYWTNIDNTTKSSFIVPTDSAKDRLMVSVHYVDNSMYWSNQIGNENWKQYSINQLELLKRAFTSRGIPVFIGETTTSTSYKGHFASDAEITEPYKAMDYMLRLIKSYGFVPVLWDTCDSFYLRDKGYIYLETDEEVIMNLSKELADGTFVPIETGYLDPMSKEDALGVINSGDSPLNLASGTADASMVGAVKIKYIFDCAMDVSFNEWSSISLSATVADKDYYYDAYGSDGMKFTGNEAVLNLTDQINEGDSYSVYASTGSWEDAEDYVFLIRCIEFIDKDGNVIKTIDKSNKTEEPSSEPTSDSSSDTSSEPSDNSSIPSDSSNNPTKPSPNASISTVAPKVTADNRAEQALKDKQKAENKVKKAKVKKLTAKSGTNKRITVNWKKVSNAKGYEIQVSNKKNFKNVIFRKYTTSRKLTIKSKKIKSNKTYYVRIRAYATYKNANGKKKKVYGRWTKKIKVKSK